MEKTRSIRLRQLHGQLGEITYQLTKMQFVHFSTPEAWRPAINAYRCRDRILICVDLAGVDRSQIDLRVEPQRLILRGHRHPPEPDCAKDRTIQILAMEIDHGTFQREVVFPSNVDPQRVTAEQRDGFLWIDLPLSAHG